MHANRPNRPAPPTHPPSKPSAMAWTRMPCCSPLVTPAPADREIRHLLAYGREFYGDRPYKLDALTQASGMTLSGIRTAYSSSEIGTVAREIGRRPDSRRARPLGGSGPLMSEHPATDAPPCTCVPPQSTLTAVIEGTVYPAAPARAHTPAAVRTHGAPPRATAVSRRPRWHL
ncbi:hypothetical protein [Streptomyces sp. NPDC006285]|uniref:hypothetical protein n=1 Tax=Streptomyces sp. NPDC006285 TaxID=3364742 RepID=UPI0036B3D31A